LLRLYEATFTDRATAIGREGFHTALEASQDVRYHLWALRATRFDAIAGLASFFVLPRIGFGGYMCLAGKLRRAGNLRPLVTRIERCMLRDKPALPRWYIECAGEPELSIFHRIGFRELDVRYVQPNLHAADEAPDESMHLLYRWLSGATPPIIQAGDLLEDVRNIYEYVYRLDDASSQVLTATLRDTLSGRAVVPVLPSPP
jgi:hypothetical protein